MASDHHIQATSAADARIYSRPARIFHWSTAAGVFVMVPLGFAMTRRGNTLGIWDGLTDAMYSSHKTIGFLLLWLVVARLAYRLAHGAPADEPGLPRWYARGVHLAHWLLYGLLLFLCFSGWVGVSLFPALDLFGIVDLPALVSPDENAAGRVLAAHGLLAILLALLASGHAVAAFGHHFLWRDGVLRRMLPGLRMRP